VGVGRGMQKLFLESAALPRRATLSFHNRVFGSKSMTFSLSKFPSVTWQKQFLYVMGGGRNKTTKGEHTS
jgi:hypothetical protein